MSEWAVGILAYLVGSFDFAVVVARTKGLDIRLMGSGNPGTSNVLRSMGKGPASVVLIGDLMKGVLTSGIGWIVGGITEAHDPMVLALFAGFAAVVGHCFPIWHRFRGGKGVATGAGVMLFVVPIAALVLAAIWVLIARLLKVASVASLSVAVCAIPLGIWRGVEGWGIVWLAAIVVLVVVRHAPNILRLARGSEGKVPI